MQCYLGTSGWNYRHWREAFYPSSLSASEWLSFYAERFASVEINATFYRLPSDESLDTWRESVPADFRFAVKASRYITHMKKLKDPAESIQAFFDKVDRLGDRLGPILFQLPPRWHVNVERLAAFLEALPPGYRYAFEFRDESWWTEPVTDLLAEHGAAFCLFDLEGQTTPAWTTADFVYLRWHGSDGRYQGRYPDTVLDDWAGRIRRWTRDGREVFGYFDNDAQAQAPQDADRLLNRLES
ncbi:MULTISPECIES: DUF72 domain-containing protein [unclassified Guyparkeria]|uniref:DUF72 domain-containing protein n=1 Tax=unclassified Guyparkeria TaxID=2626246 RepID=UPI0007337351|nr:MULTISPECIES: DUF72 domain-containing protein [unclassified Guyparkeria]KTG17520.1 hypothetical protein AUR63_07635 [Guyparkeria sp. XI15]OAE88335.1 hypothetical protein AWR35_07650 [Guyparkeria sp. WRN-7]